MRLSAAELRNTGTLRPKLTDEQAASLGLANSPGFQLVTDDGYTPAQYADLLADFWIHPLLTQGI